MNVLVQRVADIWVIDPSALSDHYLQKEISDSQKDNYINLSIERPGSIYSRNQQNLWHKLLSLYFKSGLHSSADFDCLRTTHKMRYGVIESLIYTLPDGTIEVRKPYNPPPLQILEKTINLKSTSKYNKDEYRRLIDGTISEMKQAGVISSLQYGDEFESILETVEKF